MKNAPLRVLLLAVFILYCLILARFVVFKGPFSELVDHLKNYNSGVPRTGYSWANFIPFKTLYYYLSLQEDAETGMQNIGGNILLFVPYGFLLPLVFEGVNKVWNIVLVLLATSLFFELVQLILAIGSFDVDDLLLNVLGGLAGYGLLKLLRSSGRS